VPDLTLSGSFGYLKSKFKVFITRGNDPVTGLPGAIFDYSAVNAIYSPKVTASLNATYTIPVGFGEADLNVGYRYISRYDQQISIGPFTRTVDANGVPTIVVLSNDPRVRSDRQNLLDASAAIRFDLGGNQAKLAVFGRNLLDDRGPNAAFTVAGLWSFASAREPRTYGVQLSYEF